MDASLLTVFIYALFTAAATGLGVLPFIFLKGRKPSEAWLGYADAAAAGMMLSASFALIFEAHPVGPQRMILGLVLGTLLVAFGRPLLDRFGKPEFSALSGDNARQAIFIIAIMTLHSGAEGVALGVSFGGGESLGIYMTAAIAVHNIPEGLAIAMMTIPRGMKILPAAFWCIFSSLPQPLLAVPAYLFVSVFGAFLPVGLGLAAGAMLWMILDEILPEAREKTPRGRAILVALMAMTAMLAFQEVLAACR